MYFILLYIDGLFLFYFLFSFQFWVWSLVFQQVEGRVHHVFDRWSSNPSPGPAPSEALINLKDSLLSFQWQLE